MSPYLTVKIVLQQFNEVQHEFLLTKKQLVKRTEPPWFVLEEMVRLRRHYERTNTFSFGWLSKNSTIR